MEYKLESNTLRFFLEGRIDSTNASKTEEEMTSLRKTVAHDRTVVDAEKLEYISSAGLRVLLRLRKEEGALCVTNVSNQVYDVFEMTGFTEMMTVEKAYRTMSVEGCDVLGQGASGIVYRYDPETVVKVYHRPDALDDIRRERELARKALVLGIPTAIPFDVVKVGDQFASVFELLNATSLSKLIEKNPDNIEFYVDLFVELLKQIHAIQVDPKDMVDQRQVVLGWVEYLRAHIPQSLYDKLHALVEAVPRQFNLLHGDFHTNNVEVQNGELLLIDMDTLCYGHPIFELGNIYPAFVGFGELDRTAVERFLGLPYDTAVRIWDLVLKDYFPDRDEACIHEIDKKAQVVAYVRLLRRTICWEPENNAGIRHYAAQLARRIDEVDSLLFE